MRRKIQVLRNDWYAERRFISDSTMSVSTKSIKQGFFSPYFCSERMGEAKQKAGTCAPLRRFEGASLPASELLL